MANETPIFRTAYTPSYSNEAYALIGTAVGRMVGTSFEDVFNDRLVGALGLKGTSYTVPAEITDNDVIPVSPHTAWWDSELGPYGP